MKTPIKIFLTLTTVVILIFSSSSCKKEKGILSTSKVFDTARFRQNLQVALNGAIGYTFVIARNGQIADSVGFGVGAIDAAAGSAIRPNIYHDINIASVTKTFTAMAVIKLMQEKGQLMNFPIGLWLPNSWPKHSDISDVRFGQLLSHTSGIRMASTSYDSLRFLVNQPIQNSRNYAYANANFGLFRIILPKLYDADAFNQQENALSPSDFDAWIGRRYIEIMNEIVFEPCRIQDADCNIDPNKITLQAFSEPNGLTNPQSFGDWTNRSGGGGFYLSTVEMGQVMAYLVHTYAILTEEQKLQMDTSLYGWDPNDVFDTNYGRVYGKDGALFRDLNNDQVVSSGDAGLQTWVGKFPNKVELALSVTSINNGFRNLPQLIRQAYENAWVDKE